MAKHQAIDGRRLNAFAVDPDNLVIIGLDTKDGPEHPLYDERIKLPVHEGTVNNMMLIGCVLEPVLGRKNGDVVEVVDGRQRVRCAREANRRRRELLVERTGNDDGYEPIFVPIMLRRDRETAADGAVTSLDVMIAANELRQEDSLLAKARKAQRLIDQGRSIAYLMDTFGLSQSGVKNLLALNELDDRVQKAISDRRLPYTAALELKDLARDEQWAKAEELIAKGGGVVAEAKRQKQQRRKNGAKNGAKNGDESRGKRPPVTTLRKIADDKEFMVGLRDASAADLLLWILGEESRAGRIKGLTEFLRGGK